MEILLKYDFQMVFYTDIPIWMATQYPITYSYSFLRIEGIPAT